MGVRETRRQEKQQLILDRARELFYSRGYQNTSMKDIAVACTLGMNAIYSVFQSKEQICAQLFLFAQAPFAREFRAVLAGPGSLPEKNRELVALYIDFYSSHNFLYEIVWLVESGQIQATLDPETLAAIHRGFGELLTEYHGYLEGLARQGVVAPDLDLEVLTATFWSMMSGMAANYLHRTVEITGVSNQAIRYVELDMVLKYLQYKPEEEMGK